MAKILVLSTHDSHLRGHGWYTEKLLKEQGHETCFIACFRRNADTSNFFYDATRRFGLATIWQRFLPYLTCLFAGKRPDVHAFASTHLFGVSAKKILEKCPFKPDFIYLKWTDNFLKEKTISDLQKQTGAEIIFFFVDEAYLAACHYPANCDKWKNGCHHCEALRINKWMASRCMRNRNKYWTDIEGAVICSPYEDELVRDSPFLNNKKVFLNVAITKVPYYSSKEDARKFFGIDDCDFVLFAGANSFKGKRKGMAVFADASKIIADRIEEGVLQQDRRITLLLIGNGAGRVKFDKRLNIISKQFLPSEHFFKAYYACDVHVSPTLADSGPIMVNYSFACKRPVVAFPVGIAATLVKDRETGFLAEYGSAIDLADKIICLYNMDKTSISDMGERCLAFLNSFKGTKEPFLNYLNK